MQTIAIYPSLISANLLQLGNEIEALESYCDGFHIDVMDYHFVPNLTWGSAFVNAIRNHTTKRLWVHLMMEKTLSFIETIHLAPGDIVSFHIEEKIDFNVAIKSIKAKKMKVSIAIKPKTPLAELFSLLPYIDQVLLMSVEPGFSGQPFLPDSLQRLQDLIEYRKEKSLLFTIGMDGGIDATIIGTLARMGVAEVGVAAGIFGHSNRVRALLELYDAAKKI